MLRRVSPLAAISTLIVCIAVVPLLIVLAKGVSNTDSHWSLLWNTHMAELLWNTFSLASVVAIASTILGVSSAWLVTRRTFPGRRIAVWLMVLPLAVPSYVYAQIYINLTDNNGWISQFWQALFGTNAPLPSLTNLAGVSFVLSIASFPYVFLLVRSALLHSNRNLEEAARIHGLNAKQVFWRINLPLLRPALAAGVAFVVLHVLSDFGAVYFLNYETFTKAIFVQMEFRGSYSNAAALSFILILFSTSFILLDRFFRKRQRYFSMSSSVRKLSIKSASRKETLLIWTWLGCISLFAIILPLFRLLVWTLEVADKAFTTELWVIAGNSMLVAFLTASVATVVALPLVLFHQRRQSRLSQSYLHLSSVGLVLPGPVVALGIALFVFNIPLIYGGMMALVLALVIRFLPLAVQSEEAAVQQLTPSIEQAARNLGANAFESLRRVVLPLISSGLATAWVLVFIDTLKELPATFLLRPIGFDTLPVRIWIEVTEEMLELAAPAALLLVLTALPAIWLIMRKEKY